MYLGVAKFFFGVWRVAPVGSHSLGDFVFVILADAFFEVFCEAPLKARTIADKVSRIWVIDHSGRAVDERLWGKRGL